MAGMRPVLARVGVAASVLISAIGGHDPARAAGALAVGNCGAYGVSYDYSQPDAASAAALGKCTGDCKLATEMKHSCAALAIDGHNACGAFGFASAGGLAQAQNTALLYCYKNGGKDCVIRAFVCDAKG